MSDSRLSDGGHRGLRGEPQMEFADTRMTSSDAQFLIENERDVLRALTRVAAARGLAEVQRCRSIVGVERCLVADADVRAILRLACDTARQRGLHAERLVLILKDSWHTLAYGRILEGRDTDLALNELVSMCIAEFYRPMREEAAGDAS